MAKFFQLMLAIRCVDEWHRVSVQGDIILLHLLTCFYCPATQWLLTFKFVLIRWFALDLTLILFWRQLEHFIGKLKLINFITAAIDSQRLPI